MKRDAPSIVGWAHTPFGRHDGLDLEALVSAVAPAALAHAGLDTADIDAVVLGHCNMGFVRQDFNSSLVLQSLPALRFKPAVRVENACATGSAAIHAALDRLEAGHARAVLVVGAEKMTELAGAAVGDALVRASYVKEEGGQSGGFAGIFAGIAQRYFARWGDVSDAMAMIAAKNHRNGVDNPYAQMRRDLGVAFCNDVSDRNPYVAPPLRRTDCSMVSDGAAAVVIADAATARRAARRVRFRARTQVNDFLPMSSRDILAFEGPALAWRRALDAAGISLDDLDLVETHDCFTIAELLEYEAMGLAAPGDGARAIREGWTARDGRLPVNVSGGLKAKGHPIGATGVSMHVMAAMQLTGTAPPGLQLPGAGLAGVFNMGGAAVANYCSILEAG